MILNQQQLQEDLQALADFHQLKEQLRTDLRASIDFYRALKRICTELCKPPNPGEQLLSTVQIRDHVIHFMELVLGDCADSSVKILPEEGSPNIIIKDKKTGFLHSPDCGLPSCIKFHSNGMIRYMAFHEQGQLRKGALAREIWVYDNGALERVKYESGPEYKQGRPEAFWFGPNGNWAMCCMVPKTGTSNRNLVFVLKDATQPVSVPVLELKAA